MVVPGTVARVAAATVCALLAATGCSGGGDDAPPPPSGLIAVTTMRGALLQAADIGPTWTTRPDADPGRLVSICGGTTTPPPVPPGGEVVASSSVDQGDRGAQTLDQTALVYPDETAAKAGQAALRGLADSCRADLSVPATVTGDKSEPAYTERVRTQELRQGPWSGFTVVRHKRYEPRHPGTADTAVTVLTSRNVVLVDAYAIYRLDDASTGPAFDSDWRKLVGSVVQRVG